MMFSVIIPTLNEERYIRSCIRAIRAADSEVEIIVVDGGSEDGTPNIALQEGAIVEYSKLGRGIQLNHGAAIARGDILVFLHADTILSATVFDVLRQSFADPKIALGRCRLRFDVKHPLLQFYAACARIESVFTTFGDQCIVVRRSFFDAVGGFPEWQLFEDVALLQVARSKTRVHAFPTTVVTSARKFIKHGILRQQLRNAAMLLLYIVGVSPDRLAAIYREKVRYNTTPASRKQDILQPAKRSKQLCEHSIVQCERFLLLHSPQQFF